MRQAEFKIVFTGPMGAGKTTAIESISQLAPLRTEAANSDIAQADKKSTTVALDYGELLLSNGQKLKLFGTPGQARFDFMWKALAEGALGLIILIHDERENPVADLLQYLNAFEQLSRSGRMVIGIGRRSKNSSRTLQDFNLALSTWGVVAPVFEVDVRKKEDVQLLLEVLFNQIEFDQNFQHEESY